MTTGDATTGDGTTGDATTGDGAPRPAAADGEWHRVHPLTPVIRSWQVIAVLLVFGVQEVGRSAVGGDGSPGEVAAQVSGRVLAGGGLVLVLLLGLVGAFATLSWRATRYRVTGEALELKQGVFSRRERRASLDRLQAVDVVQPILARMAGLARLTLEVAGGGEARIQLAYLTENQARLLRNHLLAGAAGLRYGTAEAPEAPEHQALEVPTERLVGSLLLSGPAAAAVVTVAGLLAAGAVLEQAEVAAGLLPAALGAGGVLWRRFTTGFGFRIASAPDGVRLRHGLLEQRTQTVPPGRVQAVRLSQPLLWRFADWWRVEVNVASYGGRGNDERTADAGLLLPVGTRGEAVAALSFVLADLGVAGEDPVDVAVAGMTGTGTGRGFTTAPRRSRWVDPIGWRRHGFRVTDAALLLRRGVFHRQLDVVPHARTQSLGVWQGPLQRRLGVASFVLHSTPGPVSPRVAHLAADVTARLLDAQAERARRARAAAGPERWMEASAEPLQQPAESAEGARVEQFGHHGHHGPGREDA